MPSRSATVRALALAGTVGLAALSLTGAASASASGTDTSKTHVVPSLLLGLSKAQKLGPAAAGQELALTVSLNRPHPAAEAALLSAMEDPKSPFYRQFLTPAEFDAEFGVAPAVTQATRTWLTRAGLKVTTSSAAGDFFTVTGSVKQVEKTFALKEGRYRSQGKDFIANDVPPSVPTSLPIAAVSGLDTVRQFVTPNEHMKTAATKSSGSFSGVFTPKDMHGQYEIPANNEGQGSTAGLFGEGEPDTVVQNLRYFEAYQNLPKVPVRIVLTEGGGFEAHGDNAGNIEWYLDSQAITGMAPKLKQLDLYFAKTLFDHDIFADFKAWADDKNGPLQMNASFGECEANPTNPVTGPLAQIPYGTEIGDELEAIGEPVLQQANLEGRTLFSSTGDTGSGCPEVVVPVAGAGNGVAPQPLPIVNYPAASPHAVAVGGTVITSDGTDHSKRSDEVSWTDGGGGASHFIQEPSWQVPIKNVTQPCLAHPDGSTYSGVPPTCRGIPDVATLSGNITGNGYFIASDGEQSSEGGTSLSSPLMAGMWAVIQAAAPTAKGFGFADPVLYKLGANPTEYARDFHDITTGEHGVPLNGTYMDGPGWDYVSGLGSPNVTNILKDINKGKTAPRTTASTPEAPATTECEASFKSPKVNATDPLDSTGEDAQVDIATGTLKISDDKKSVVATLRGSGISATPPTDATSESFYVLWQYAGKVYYASASASTTGGSTFTSGQAGEDTYTDLAGSKATGLIGDGQVTITVPLSEVGSPKKGAQLAYPFAISQVSTGLAFTADSASAPNNGPSTSVGQALELGKICGQAVTPPKKLPTKTTTTAPTGVGSGKLPTTGLDAMGSVVGLALLGGGLLVARRR